MTSSLRTGPVAITGADGHVGRHLQARLTALPNPVRPLSRRDDWAAGTGGAVAVFHLAGTLQPQRGDSYRSANVEPVRRLLDNMSGTVERLIFLSYVGADPRSDNAYLRAKGEAETSIIDTGIPSVIVRSSLIYGDTGDVGPSFVSYLSTSGKPVSVLGSGDQKLAPIHVDDLADMIIAAALDPAVPAGTVEVGGPDILTLDEVVRLLNPPGTQLRHLSPFFARLAARIVPRLTPALVEVLLDDSVPAGDRSATADRFGVELRPLARRAVGEHQV